MKLVGFISEHNDIEESISFKERKTNLSIENNSSKLTSKILDYLEKGEIVIAFMGYFNDIESEENLLIPESYYTDGEYVWPSYLSAYLNRYSYLRIEDNFINYMIDNKFRKKRISKKRMNDIESQLVTLLQSRS